MGEMKKCVRCLELFDKIISSLIYAEAYSNEGSPTAGFWFGSASSAIKMASEETCFPRELAEFLRKDADEGSDAVARGEWDKASFLASRVRTDALVNMVPHLIEICRRGVRGKRH